MILDTRKVKNASMVFYLKEKRYAPKELKPKDANTKYARGGERWQRQERRMAK